MPMLRFPKTFGHTKLKSENHSRVLILTASLLVFESSASQSGIPYTSVPRPVCRDTLMSREPYQVCRRVFATSLANKQK